MEFFNSLVPLSSKVGLVGWYPVHSTLYHDLHRSTRYHKLLLLYAIPLLYAWCIMSDYIGCLTYRVNRGNDSTELVHYSDNRLDPAGATPELYLPSRKGEMFFATPLLRSQTQSSTGTDIHAEVVHVVNLTSPNLKSISSTILWNLQGVGKEMTLKIYIVVFKGSKIPLVTQLEIKQNITFIKEITKVINRSCSYKNFTVKWQTTS